MLCQNSLLVITSAFPVRPVFTFKSGLLYNRNKKMFLLYSILPRSAWNWELGSLQLMRFIVAMVWIEWTTTKVSENVTFLHILSMDV